METDASASPALGFRGALDPSLPLLAAQAAAEIDNAIVNLRRGGPMQVRLDSLPHLASILSNVKGNESSGHRAFGMVDAITGGIFWKAYKESFNVNPSPKDLETATETLIQGLPSSEHDHPLSSETLEHLRDFCIALSNYSANKRLAVFGGPARHPFSR